MKGIAGRIAELVGYRQLLSGDEKSEAQVFLDRLFQAFGHEGYKEAGAELEHRIRKANKNTSFADLVWKPRLLLEMKKQGTKLHDHYHQAFDYWINAVPDRPRYVVLCNFDEFEIYDLDKQIDSPVDTVALEDLPVRYSALNFLFPDNPAPVFGNDLEAVSRDAASKVASLFTKMSAREVNQKDAQRFVLQTVVAMFSEDIGLLPSNIIHNLVRDCLHRGQSSYDLFGQLFRQMNNTSPAKGGRFERVPYFNGGIFETITPIELTPGELELIAGEQGASSTDWSKIRPAIFGTIFQQSMDKTERHALGAHFTHESDIMRIIMPTITKPWIDRIDRASTLRDLRRLREELSRFTVLDPACGSGNFLYVSYREMSRIEMAIMKKIKEVVSDMSFRKESETLTLISPHQFYGIDIEPFGVEIAKITLMLAKKLAIDEAAEILERDGVQLPLNQDALPLDNLNDNIVCKDALFHDWPPVDAIVGNPPYQSKNKMQEEFGLAYVNELRDRFPDVDGRSDYCVYWFRKAHDHLNDGERAGLVGTNTIRQNYSRMSGLDYVVNNGGTITDAVSSMRWSGEADVDVSIVNWIKGHTDNVKRLFLQEGSDSTKGWSYRDFDHVGPSLSFHADVTQANTIKSNAARGGCYQGQTHGHKAFLLRPENQEDALLINDSINSGVIFPYLIANIFIGKPNSLPDRYVIDFHMLNLFDAAQHEKLFGRIKERVLPDREKKANDEQKRNEDAIKKRPGAKTNSHHENFLERWWQLSYQRPEMVNHLRKLSRYIVCGRVTLRPIFDFVSPQIRPNDSLIVFPYQDDYSFGILQSDIHWIWFVNRGATLTARPRYTSNTVFDTFPWPQSASHGQIKNVALAATKLRHLRNELKATYGKSYRQLYREMDLPGESPLKEAHSKLNIAVRAAYGMSNTEDPLIFLLELNRRVAERENNSLPVTGPGLPPGTDRTDQFITDDCLKMSY